MNHVFSTYIIGRNILILEEILLDKNVCSAGWVIILIFIFHYLRTEAY